MEMNDATITIILIILGFLAGFLIVKFKKRMKGE
jgi:F0F1-type ATP synthase assembly protein I